MKRAKKKYYKFLMRRTQREIWKQEFNISIIDNLVLEFAEKRLVLLGKELAKWKTKKQSKKELYDGTKKLEYDIKMTESEIKGAKLRREGSMEDIRVRRGKLEFIKKLIKKG